MYAPNQHFIETQRPSVLFYTIDILKFINTLFFKFQNEVHLIRLLFCARSEGRTDQNESQIANNFQDCDMSFASASNYGSPNKNQNETLKEIESFEICLPF